jgi:hypothetical protein
MKYLVLLFLLTGCATSPPIEDYPGDFTCDLIQSRRVLVRVHVQNVTEDEAIEDAYVVRDKMLKSGQISGITLVTCASEY